MSESITVTVNRNDLSRVVIGALKYSCMLRDSGQQERAQKLLDASEPLEDALNANPPGQLQGK